MQSRCHLVIARLLSATLCLVFAAALPAHAQVEAQVEAQAAPMTSVPAGAPVDAEHDAAMMRVVQAINFYPYFRQVVTPLFTTPEDLNDPSLDAFLAEVMPVSWVNDFLLKLFKPVLNGLSDHDLDEAARYFRSPGGQKYVALQMRMTDALKNVPSGPPVRFTPAENAAFERFSRSPAGLAFSRSGMMMSGTAASAWGEQVGKQRMLDVLKAAQSRYTAMNDADFQVEADKLHGGASGASPVGQLAIIVEYNARSQHRMTAVFTEGNPALQRVAAMQPKDLISKDSIAQMRQDLQVIDDLYVTSNETVQMSGQFTLECTDLMAVPGGIKKVWRNAFDKQFKKTGEAMGNLTASIQEFTTSLRALIDFTEAHAGNISLDKEGKLVFANPDDLAMFRALSAQTDRTRAKLRDSAGAARST